MSDPGGSPGSGGEPTRPLDGKTVWIPQMSRSASTVFAAALRGVGIDARICPDSDEHTLALASQHTSGDECLPARVTLGAFLTVAGQPGFVPDRHAFFMPTADGPCRFGQYAPHIRQVLVEVGLGAVTVVSPSSRDGYKELGNRANELMRVGYQALVCADILRKLLHRVRPYEVNPGDTDAVHAAGACGGREACSSGRACRSGPGWLDSSRFCAPLATSSGACRPARRAVGCSSAWSARSSAG